MIGIGWARDERVWRPDIIYALRDSNYSLRLRDTRVFPSYLLFVPCPPVLYGIPDTDLFAVFHMWGIRTTAPIDAQNKPGLNRNRMSCVR